MIYHGHFTHPELWMMWFAVIGTGLNTIAIAVFAWRNR
jgi:hypothetical protein